MTTKQTTLSNRKASPDVVQEGVKRAFREWKVSTAETPPTNKRRKTRYYYTDDQWESMKANIERLFIVEDLALQEVAKAMNEQFDFDASLPQYKERLKKWGLSKYIKFSQKQLVYMAIQLAKRSAIGKKTRFNLEHNRLDSRNVERVMNRRLRKSDLELEVASMTSSMNTLGISAHTSSTVGVRASMIQYLKGKTSFDFSFEDFLRFQIQGSFCVQIVDLPIRPFTRESYRLWDITYETRYNLRYMWRLHGKDLRHLLDPRRTFNPWQITNDLEATIHEKQIYSLLLDIALDIVDGKGLHTMVNTMDHGPYRLPEVKLILCFYHLTGLFCSSGENSSTFVVKLYHGGGYTTVLIFCTSVTILEGETPDYRHFRTFSDMPEIREAIALRRNGERWPDQFLYTIQVFIYQYFCRRTTWRPCSPGSYFDHLKPPNWNEPFTDSENMISHTYTVSPGTVTRNLFLGKDRATTFSRVNDSDTYNRIEVPQLLRDESPPSLSLDDIMHSTLWSNDTEEGTARTGS